MMIMTAQMVVQMMVSVDIPGVFECSHRVGLDDGKRQAMGWTGEGILPPI